MREHAPQGREPQSNAEYLEPSYWDERFTTEQAYEWFKGYGEFRHLLLPHLKPKDRILVLGCGNSSLTADLWADGFPSIISIDISEASVQDTQGPMSECITVGNIRCSWQHAKAIHNLVHRCCEIRDPNGGV